MISPFKSGRAHPSSYYTGVGPCPRCGSRRIGMAENYLTAMIALIRCYDCGLAETGEGETEQEAEMNAQKRWRQAR